MARDKREEIRKGKALLDGDLALIVLAIPMLIVALVIGLTAPAPAQSSPRSGLART